jgi:1,6-anhydro-N-acetylmuramate kinase
MNRLAAALAPAAVISTGEPGIEPDWVEAAAFA